MFGHPKLRGFHGKILLELLGVSPCVYPLMGLLEKRIVGLEDKNCG